MGALARGRHIREAPDSLRDLLLERYHADAVVLTGSGTQALQLGIFLGLQRHGSDAAVALPGFGCYDLATAVVGAGAKTRIYDLDPTTLAPDPASLERMLASGCRIAVVAPFYGVPVDWGSIDVLCRRYGATVIEDAAQGHGAEWQGRRVGSLGEISVLSFGRGKGWTGGHGGALLLRGSFGANRTPGLAASRPGATALVSLTAQWLFSRRNLYRVPASIPALGLGETRYKEPATPAAMDAPAAFLALRNDAASRREIGARRQAAAEYDRLCREANVEFVLAPIEGVRGALRYPVLVRPEARQSPLLRPFGAVPGYPRPLAELAPLQPLLQPPFDANPGARRLADQLLTLPTHSGVRPRDRVQMVAQLEELQSTRG